jgi:hypothetical protein
LSTFKRYHHSVLGHEAVKVGFSWPAAFFGFWWMLYKRLWGLAGLFSLGFIFLGVCEGVVENATGAPDLQLVASLLLICGWLSMALVPGFRGNDWVRNRLRREGYEEVGSVQAESKELALLDWSSGEETLIVLGAKPRSPSEPRQPFPFGLVLLVVLFLWFAWDGWFTTDPEMVQHQAFNRVGSGLLLAGVAARGQRFLRIGKLFAEARATGRLG